MAQGRDGDAYGGETGALLSGAEGARTLERCMGDVAGGLWV